MKFTLSWLKEYTSVKHTPSQLAEKLTMAGLEVDSLANKFAYLDKVVVSRVEHVQKHPSADNLTCCRVNVGGYTSDSLLSNKDSIETNDENRECILHIVCGASNVREGLVVPCALVGAILPGDLEIKKSKLRGEISEGMLCSAAELMLDDSLNSSTSSGIMELDSNLIPGTPLAKALNLDDYIFEVGLTPNRPDCLSVIGLAREVAAFSDPAEILNIPFCVINHEPTLTSINDFASVEIFDPDLCSRYTAGMLIDVKVAPSPFWLKDRLLSVGLTPINNIVDVTNLVMMETGQPLHAFDYDNIAKGRIEVKRAGGNIEFKTLDSKSHILEPEMLMICDGDRPIGIAGVMGGENSEILDTTTRVLVESACFNSISIRKTAKRSGINTDASHRFERGVDPEITKYALERAISLMAQLSGGKILNGLIDKCPVKHINTEILVNTDSLNSRLGTNLSYSEIRKYIESVGFKVTQNKTNIMLVTVPSFRVDVTRPEDISEEVARLLGYNNIKTSFPAMPTKVTTPSKRIVVREKIRDIMNGFGFCEAVNYSFTAASSCNNLELELSDERRSVEEIINPISEELAVLRTSLIPGLLENMKRNNFQQIDTLRLFEVGKIFIAKNKGEQPIEREMIAGIWTGLRNPISWDSKTAECDFFDIKGIAQGLCFAVGLGTNDIFFEKADPILCPYYQKGQGATINLRAFPFIADSSTDYAVQDVQQYVQAADVSNPKIIGSAGKINSKVLRNFGLKQSAYVFEIDMDRLLSIIPTPESMITTKPLPKFPSLSRDITFIIDSKLEVGTIFSDIVALKESFELLEDVFIFDLYEGEPLAAGKKSLSMRIIYRSWEKTLSEKMINGIHTDITKRILESYDADLP